MKNKIAERLQSQIKEEDITINKLAVELGISNTVCCLLIVIILLKENRKFS